MLIGSDRILVCPICGTYAKVRTLMSGNTFGALRFTDGSMIAPHLPDMPYFTNCRTCGKRYWLDDDNTVWDPWSKEPQDPEICAQAEYVEKPTPEDFSEALRDGLATDTKQEKYLRVRYWWAVNAAGQRPANDAESNWPLDMFDNLRSLEAMLDESDPNARLMKTEIARETGRFEDAMKLLDWEFPEGFEPAVELIRKLAAEGETKVALIKETEE